jgi:ABC-type nitrate/sulfonate/bicarbonate transport system substrate-binding protein
MSGAAREHAVMVRALIALVATVGLLGACNAPPAAPAARQPASGAAAPAAPAATTGSPPAPVKMKTAYTTAGASMATVWLADETGGFAREGIDAEVSFIGAGQAILGALSSQEAPIVLAGGNQVIEANLQGGEYVMLGTASPYLTNSIYVHPSIQRPEDLRGKSIGVSNFGAISHVAVKIALDHWGMQEGRDVAVVRSGGTPETLAAMQSGGIAGGSFSPPQSFRARDLGFRELIDIDTLHYEFSSAAIVSTRRYVAEHPDLVERYLKGMIRGSHAFKTNKDAAVDSIMRNARVDDRAVAEETWAYFVDKTSDDLVMSPRAVENNLRMLAEEQPGAASARVDQFYDPSFVERIKASGFVDQVRRGQ